MEVNPYNSEGDEVFEDTYVSDVTDLLSPANLDIQKDEWNLLIRTDQELAAQIGHFLLKRNKNLEMLITTTETCAEEHKIRANHYEKQIRYMRDSMEAQAKSYENFEKQVHDLTASYQKISDECRQYKERNKSLWEVVASLEEKCEEYLVELEMLKSSQTYEKSELPSKDCLLRNDIFSITDDIETSRDNNAVMISRDTSAECVDQWESDIVSLKVFAEETCRKYDIERCQRVNSEFKLERAHTENKDLRRHILFLEHRIKSQSNEVLMPRTPACRLIRSKSMNSLDEINFKCEHVNNIQLEVDQCNMKDEGNYTIRELFHRLNHNKEESKENTHNRHRLSVTKNMGARRTSDMCSPICLDCKRKMSHQDNVHLLRHDSGRVASSKQGDNTVANYRDMFAQIFEKLKISRIETPTT